MFKPNKFIQSNPSEGVIKYVLSNYWRYVNVKEYCNVLEVGCGPGNCTHDILLPLFPKTLQSYVGTDISRPMIEYAQEHYQNEPRLKFEVMDVCVNCLPQKFLAVFDHILSFQCLHFVSDHRKAVENMYKMTKPGGDIFISFAGKATLFDVYEELSQNGKWRAYLQSYRDFVCPTHFCEDPSLYFEAVLKEVGFSPVWRLNMFKPNKFIQSVAPSEGVIKYVLRNYWRYVNVKEYCNVLEVGCGPGNCTHDILLPLFPKTLQSYVGTDISRPMIEYAQAHYQNEPRLKFEVMDVGVNCLPQKFLAAFDHILSFQCLHFVSDHRNALENMYKMTKPGGDIFITFAGKAIIFDVYEELSQSDKWRPYLQSYRDFVCPTHFCEDPSLYFEAVLKEVGFSPVVCISLKKNFVLSKKSFLTFVEAICMYPIPKNLMDNFLADTLEEMERRGCVDGDNVTYPYTLLIAHAAKLDGAS